VCNSSGWRCHDQNTSLWAHDKKNLSKIICILHLVSPPFLAATMVFSKAFLTKHSDAARNAVRCSILEQVARTARPGEVGNQAISSQVYLENVLHFETYLENDIAMLAHDPRESARS